MKIYYGILENVIDVTTICMERLMINDKIKIPSGDLNRSHYFSDPLFGIHKKIFIVDNNTITEYDELINIEINILTNEIKIISETEIHNKLIVLHSKLKLNYGTFREELPEQKMVVRYLTGNEKVLEIGGNIGRNSLIIASIVSDYNLVTLECNLNIAKQLIENRDLNGLKFHIESSALSKRKLIQNGWDTIPSDMISSDILAGFEGVNTITLEQLHKKYNIEFDTLVLDCEGAFYYILMDMPEILDNIKLIIMENDYYDISHKQYIDNKLKEYEFKREYVESGGWEPCKSFFFEVWSRK